MKNIYVAATGQHIGKTTCTLGLTANLIRQGFKTGYCKPVGQKHITFDGKVADKDAVLFSQVIGFELDPEIHSPVIIGKGVTKQYIENKSQFNFFEDINVAARHMTQNHEVVVYEGTGHPGVGSVCDLSNAEVARRLDAGVVMIVEGGIGRTIDKLHLSTAVFREKNVPILGVIVNKVRSDKYEEIQYYLSKKFTDMDLPLLGILPYDRSLSFPIMETVCRAIKGKVHQNPEKMSNRVEDIVAGSLVDMEEFQVFQNILLVSSAKRLREAVEKVDRISKLKKLEKSPISGVIVTGDGRHEHWYEQADLDHPYFRQHQIPVITTTLDTYGSVLKINRIEVKINTRTPWKVQRAIELIREHVDFDSLLDHFSIERKGVL